ncbi:hypothetical protein BST27_26425 [Mycobacterium intermedium]|uniref:DUF3558 domain-containing protein n=1 Tax=Mycobacterium intermedium TaxID=28445 RepID=A0A1X0F1M3_MYCIE|nr:hypothetical protein [Mycobacterium intermedium]MCV6962627.1 hypothetical protein [Mycobacterium intermedium]ORA95702.1 hypothetical protein BST27_26425 [Mycobacterium intermedium]
MCRARAVVAATLLGTALTSSACGADANGASSDIVHVPANLCALLSADEVSQAIGKPYPVPTRTHDGLGQQDCESVPAEGNTVSFTLFWGNCVDGRQPNMDCRNSVSGTFTRIRQEAATTNAVEQIPNLGEQAFCTPGPYATVTVLKRWYYLTAVADTCAQAQRLAGALPAKLG